MKNTKRNVSKKVKTTAAVDWQPSEQAIKFAAVAVRESKLQMLDSLSTLMSALKEVI